MDTKTEPPVSDTRRVRTPDVEAFADALARVEVSVRAVYAGDPGPFAELWSRGDDSTLFGAFGPAKRGWRQLQPVFPWVASRYHGGRVSIEYVIVVEGADTAYTVGYENAFVSIDGGPPSSVDHPCHPYLPSGDGPVGARPPPRRLRPRRRQPGA